MSLIRSGALRALVVTLALGLPAGAVADTAADPSLLPEGISEAADEAEALEEDFPEDPQTRDPWEPVNRVVFGANDVLDAVLLDPITEGYQLLVPEFGRRCVRRLFLNLNSPSVLVNTLLQGRFRAAATTTGRLVVNTALGWGGLFDAAKEIGWQATTADFGQTLALAGVESGPYVVLPLFGPSTVRDGFGDLVDRGFQPLTYLLGPAPQIVLGAGNGLAIREENDEALDALEESAVDFYAVMRSAYFQSREAEIWKHTRRVESFDGGAATLASARD